METPIGPCHCAPQEGWKESRVDSAFYRFETTVVDLPSSPVTLWFSYLSDRGKGRGMPACSLWIDGRTISGG